MLRSALSSETMSEGKMSLPQGQWWPGTETSIRIQQWWHSFWSSEEINLCGTLVFCAVLWKQRLFVKPASLGIQSAIAMLLSLMSCELWPTMFSFPLFCLLLYLHRNWLNSFFDCLCCRYIQRNHPHLLSALLCGHTLKFIFCVYGCFADVCSTAPRMCSACRSQK